VVKIGKDVKVNKDVHIAAIEKVTIGDRVLIASGVYISDHSHGAYSGDQQSSPLIPPNDRPLVAKHIWN
jgi:lipopolysaccharide O-acetyltransferase